DPVSIERRAKDLIENDGNVSSEEEVLRLLYDQDLTEDKGKAGKLYRTLKAVQRVEAKFGSDRAQREEHAKELMSEKQLEQGSSHDEILEDYVTRIQRGDTYPSFARRLEEI